MSGMLGLDPQMLQQILQMMSMQKSDPFSKPMPGEGLLGAGGMAMPQQGGMVESMQGEPNMGGQPQEQKNHMDTVSTSFTGTQPGLPNLPDSFGGFGFGQFAPKEFSPPGLRQQYIQNMLKMLPHLEGMQGLQNNSSPGMSAIGSMMGMPGMGGF